MLSQLARVAMLSSLFLANVVRSVPQRRATVCNGQASFCSRGYGNITFVGTHNSYAVSANDNLFANQDQNITTQLNDGIRMLQVQVHNKDGVLELCHSSCTAQDSGPLVDYLKTVKLWLDANPNEVLSLLIVNINNQPPSSYDTVFKAASLDNLLYTPSKSTLTASEWPTLGSMIDSGKRLVTFMDSNADFDAVPYIIAEFLNMWETAYNIVDANNFDCAVNRTQGDTNTQMSLINHFLDRLVLGNPAPDKTRANVTNAATGFGSLGTHVSTCAAQNGRNPNFLLVNFYEFGGGSVFQVAADANGVSYNPTTPVSSPANSTTSAKGSSITTTRNSALPSSTIQWSSVTIVFCSVVIGAWLT